jgi:hypothetical protein
MALLVYEIPCYECALLSAILSARCCATLVFDYIYRVDAHELLPSPTSSPVLFAFAVLDHGVVLGSLSQER